MRRSALLAVTLVTGVALVAGLVGTGSADHPGSQTLTFVERNNLGTFRVVDLPPRARGEGGSVSAGDVVVGSNWLYNAANERRVGKFFFQCRAILGKRRVERAPFRCDGSFELRRGTLQLEALVRFSQRVVRGAITGGTEAFEGASGGVTFDNRARRSVDTVHFDKD
jgi:hypothetical protein